MVLVLHCELKSPIDFFFPKEQMLTFLSIYSNAITLGRYCEPVSFVVVFLLIFLHNLPGDSNEESMFKNTGSRGRSQDGRGIGQGDHFLPYKFTKRTIQRRANFTKHLLITSWGPQVPRKAAHCLRKEVGQNINDKKKDQRARDGDLSQEGSLNRGSFQTPGSLHRLAWIVNLFKLIYQIVR